MPRLQLAIEQIVFARNYTLGLLDQIKTDDWFRMPPGSITHVGWQVGHIAFSEYRLALWRIRGPQPQDDALFSPEFKRLFGANSVPQADSAFSPDEVRVTLNRVHEQVLRELPGLAKDELDQSVQHPHPIAKTKMLALLPSAQARKGKNLVVFPDNLQKASSLTIQNVGKLLPADD